MNENPPYSVGPTVLKGLTHELFHNLHKIVSVQLHTRAGALTYALKKKKKAESNTSLVKPKLSSRDNNLISE